MLLELYSSGERTQDCYHVFPMVFSTGFGFTKGLS